MIRFLYKIAFLLMCIFGNSEYEDAIKAAQEAMDQVQNQIQNQIDALSNVEKYKFLKKEQLSEELIENELAFNTDLLLDIKVFEGFLRTLPQAWMRDWSYDKFKATSHHLLMPTSFTKRFMNNSIHIDGEKTNYTYHPEFDPYNIPKYQDAKEELTLRYKAVQYDHLNIIDIDTDSLSGFLSSAKELFGGDNIPFASNPNTWFDDHYDPGNSTMQNIMITRYGAKMSGPYACAYNLSANDKYSTYGNCVFVEPPILDKKYQNYLNSINTIAPDDDGNELSAIKLESRATDGMEYLFRIVDKGMQGFLDNIGATNQYLTLFFDIITLLFYISLLSIILMMLYNYIFKGKIELYTMSKYLLMLILYRFTILENDLDYIMSSIHIFLDNISYLMIETLASNYTGTITDSIQLKTKCLEALWIRYVIGISFIGLILAIVGLTLLYFGFSTAAIEYGFKVIFNTFGAMIFLTIFDYYIVFTTILLFSIALFSLPISMMLESTTYFPDMLKRNTIVLLETCIVFLLFTFIYYMAIIFLGNYDLIGIIEYFNWTSYIEIQPVEFPEPELINAINKYSGWGTFKVIGSMIIDLIIFSCKTIWLLIQNQVLRIIAIFFAYALDFFLIFILLYIIWVFAATITSSEKSIRGLIRQVISYATSF